MTSIHEQAFAALVSRIVDDKKKSEETFSELLELMDLTKAQFAHHEQRGRFAVPLPHGQPTPAELLDSMNDLSRRMHAFFTAWGPRFLSIGVVLFKFVFMRFQVQTWSWSGAASRICC